VFASVQSIFSLISGALSNIRTFVCQLHPLYVHEEVAGGGGASTPDTSMGGGASTPDTSMGGGASTPDTAMGGGASTPDTSMGGGASRTDQILEGGANWDQTQDLCLCNLVLLYWVRQCDQTVQLAREQVQ